MLEIIKIWKIIIMYDLSFVSKYHFKIRIIIYLFNYNIYCNIYYIIIMKKYLLVSNLQKSNEICE